MCVLMIPTTMVVQLSTNTNAIMETLIGDGQTTIIYLTIITLE